MDGLCATPSEWKELNPSRSRPKKHQPLTHQETLETINAFRPETMIEIKQRQAEIDDAWKRMQNYW